MFVNFALLEKNNFKWNDNPLLVLQCVHQKEYERLENCSDTLNLLWKQLFLTLIDGKKGEPNYLKVRLSPFGKKLLKDVGIKELTDESLHLSQKLINLYESSGLEIKNRKKIVELISWLTSELPDISTDTIFSVVENYVNITPPKFTMNLNNLIWRPENIWQKNWNLSQSKLYSLLQKQ